MSAYDAVYTAARQAFGGTQEELVKTFRELFADVPYNVTALTQTALCQAQDAFCEWERPSVLWRPTLGIDGDQWCALYGSNLQEGVAGFGKSPDQAMADFDANWVLELKEKKTPAPEA